MRIVTEGTVTAVTAGPGVSDVLVTVQGKRGLRNEFFAPDGVYKRGDRVAIKWVKLASTSNHSESPE